ncbi:MAG: electron transfer flavoprotein subunit alpha [Micavibrio sp.]|nr:electron transfer flavoprotein subunit alpha [Micavibrio sp.]
MSILVIAEHDNQTIKPSTLSTITAARKIDSDVHLLVAGHNMDGALAQAANIHGIMKVLKAEHSGLEHALAENLSRVICDLADHYTHILAPATTFGKNVMPRVAALLDTQQISDITAVIDGDTFERPIYGGQAIATVKSSDTKKIVTVRSTMFDAVTPEGGNAPTEEVTAHADFDKTAFISLEESKSDRPELTSAGIVVSGGRGGGSGDDFTKLIEPLADKLGAAVGASRAAVDAGYVPNDYQVGQTGKIVAPDLYMAIGISGAIQHLAGMKDSKVIVAINKDEDAPIFQVADYGLVADLFETVPELMQKL